MIREPSPGSPARRATRASARSLDAVGEHDEGRLAGLRLGAAWRNRRWSTAAAAFWPSPVTMPPYGSAARSFARP
jgi:hypothetical protein